MADPNSCACVHLVSAGSPRQRWVSGFFVADKVFYGLLRFISPSRLLKNSPTARLERVDQMFVLTMAAYNLVRMRSLAEIRLQGGR
jgi:hypothetical protein